MKLLIGLLALSVFAATPVFAQVVCGGPSSERPSQTTWVAYGEEDIGHALADFSNRLPEWSQRTVKIIRNPGREPFQSCEPSNPPKLCVTTTDPWIVLFECSLLH